jgi:Protein of unknown function (DUF3175)
MAKAQRKWSQEVTERSDALDLEPDVFTQSSAEDIAESLKRSAEASPRRKSSAFRSAMSMLTFYINRAGTQPSRGQTAEARRGERQAQKPLRPVNQVARETRLG